MTQNGNLPCISTEPTPSFTRPPSWGTHQLQETASACLASREEFHSPSRTRLTLRANHPKRALHSKPTGCPAGSTSVRRPGFLPFGCGALRDEMGVTRPCLFLAGPAPVEHGEVSWLVLPG